MSDRTSLTLQLTRAESVSRHVSMQMVDIWTLCVNKLLQTICISHVFLVQMASVHRVRFLLCWCLMVDKRTGILLNCKALVKLVKDSERTKRKMLLFCIVLINLCTNFHDIWQISVGVGQMIKNHTWNMFYVHAKCKFLIFKFSKVMQQHTEGVVGKLIWVLLEIYCSLQRWKNCANRSRIDKVIAMVRVAPFFWLTV